MVPVPTIRTDRLVMRGWLAGDRDPFVAMNADPAVMEHLQGPMPPERTDAFLGRIERCWTDHGWGLWAVEVVDVAPFVGYVGLWPAPFLPGGPGVEVGWRLARSHWGHGYAPEAAREALAFGFDTIGLDEIVSFTVTQNRPSWRVMEKIGLLRDPARDFDHPNVDPAVHPELVAHLTYFIDRDRWRERAGSAPGWPNEVTAG